MIHLLPPHRHQHPSVQHDVKPVVVLVGVVHGPLIEVALKAGTSLNYLSELPDPRIKYASTPAGIADKSVKNMINIISNTLPELRL